MHKFLCLFCLIPDTFHLIPAPNFLVPVLSNQMHCDFHKTSHRTKNKAARHSTISHHDVPVPKTVGSMKYINIRLLLFFYTARCTILAEYGGSNRRWMLSEFTERCEGCWAGYWFLAVCHASLACCETSTDLFTPHDTPYDILCGTACSNTQDVVQYKKEWPLKQTADKQWT